MMFCPSRRSTTSVNVLTEFLNSSSNLWRSEVSTAFYFIAISCISLTTDLGLANESRQVLIDQQCNAIQSIVDSDDYHNYRRNQLNHHTRSLRDMLGPLLNEGCERAIAGREIGEVTVKAWELSVKMYTSCLTFQIFFPETCAKFTSAIMNSRDHPNENPNVLQTKQIRVKLVMTPIITLRDDRSTTIRVKNLLHSDVLLMA